MVIPASEDIEQQAFELLPVHRDLVSSRCLRLPHQTFNHERRRPQRALYFIL